MTDGFLVQSQVGEKVRVVRLVEEGRFGKHVKKRPDAVDVQGIDLVGVILRFVFKVLFVHSFLVVFLKVYGVVGGGEIPFASLELGLRRVFVRLL